jgi:hypothetical protein
MAGLTVTLIEGPPATSASRMFRETRQSLRDGWELMPSPKPPGPAGTMALSPASVISHAVIDAETCPTCRAADGSALPIVSARDGTFTPPRCERVANGTGICRCTVSVVLDPRPRDPAGTPPRAYFEVPDGLGNLVCCVVAGDKWTKVDSGVAPDSPKR